MKKLLLALGLLGGCLHPLWAWQETGRYSTPAREASAVQVNGVWAYLSQGSQLYIINASDLNHMYLDRTFSVSGDTGVHGIVDIAFDNNLIYAWTSNERLIIVDVSDPSDPVQLSNTAHGDVILRYAQQIRVSGNRAYGATKIGAGQGVAIMDVSNPSAPKKIASIDTMASVAVPAGDRLYVGHGNGQGLLVYDISNEASPRLLGSSRFGFYMLDVHGIESAGEYIVLATSEGVISVDANDPLNMRRVDYKTGERTRMTALGGGLVAATHWGNGIAVYQVTTTGYLTRLYSQNCGTGKLAYGAGYLYGFVKDWDDSSLVVYNTGFVQALEVCPDSRDHGYGSANWQAIGVAGTVSWTAAANAEWITITDGSSGSGNGKVTYSVGANTAYSPRSGAVTVEGNGITRMFTVTQASAPFLTLNPASRDHAFQEPGSQTISVTGNMSWTVTSGSEWITISGKSFAEGNGTLTYRVEVNTTDSPRTGTITVESSEITRTFTINQASVPSVLEYSSWMVFEGSVRIQRIDPEGGRSQETPAMVREACNCVLVVNRENRGRNNAVLIQWDKKQFEAVQVSVQLDASGQFPVKRDRKTGLPLAERTLCSLIIRCGDAEDLLIGSFDGVYGYDKNGALGKVQQRASLSGAGTDPALYACRTGRLRLNQTVGNALGQASDSADQAAVLSRLIKKMPSVPGLAERLEETSGEMSNGSMVLIPGGTNEGTDPDFGAYSLTVDAFFMDVTEVTKAQWNTVYNWALNNGYSFDNAGSGKAANHPVHTVNWYDCVKWCNARSEKEGRTPVYSIPGQSVYRSGSPSSHTDVVQSISNNGYRLPTLTEHQYASCGGLAGKRFPWGDTITHSQANYWSSSSYSYDTSPTRGTHPTYATGSPPYTSPVGSFAANGYGLYDMSGNVWEWCWDPSDSDRTFRGGFWNGIARGLRCGSVDRAYPGGADADGGFRAVCR